MTKNNRVKLPEDLITYQEAADLVGIKRATVRWQVEVKQAIVKWYSPYTGEPSVSESDMLVLYKHRRKGRPPGRFSKKVKGRDLLLERHNHKIGLDYVAHRVEMGLKPYDITCLEHNKHLGLTSQRKAVKLLAHPYAWCEECNTLYDEGKHEKTVDILPIE